MDKWIVHLVQGMYAMASSRVCVGEGYSKVGRLKPPLVLTSGFNRFITP